MIGSYRTGIGKAHGMNNKYRDFFNCSIFGTFNIEIKEGLSPLSDFQPAFESNDYKLWLVNISNENKNYYGWAVKWTNGGQSKRIFELLTKRPISDDFKSGSFIVCVLERWSEPVISEWAKSRYWWQTFSWSPVRNADSERLWNIINIFDWSGLSVLDIGSHYGYHAFRASKLGAYVLGVETNDTTRETAKVINEHIEMQDVQFIKSDPGENYDVILYLSVHHQIDPTYKLLACTIDKLKTRCKSLLVEVILPPHFGKDLTESDIDLIIGGKTLLKYQHNVRGIRKVYLCEGSL